MDKPFIVFLMLLTTYIIAPAQTLSLDSALSISLDNYESIKAKKNYLKASEAAVENSKRDYLPDFKISAQQRYGTINAQNGPMYGFGGLGIASTSMPLPEQNWNVAFGSLYLANVNWEFFTFGQIKNNIQLARSDVYKKQTALQQEQFQHQIRVTATYLNLLAVQRMVYVQERNTERAEVFQTIAESLANNGLKPRVDASLAQAEVSNAKIALFKIQDKELELSKDLSILLGIDYTKFNLDNYYSQVLPDKLISSSEINEHHPLLAHRQNMIDYSDKQIKLFRSQNLPKLTMFGVIQGRGSGFDHNYVQDNSAFSRKYSDGVGIDRSNYLIGLGVTWNITSIFRNQSKIKRQKFNTLALQDEYKLLFQELKAQTNLAEEKMLNALAHKKESPTQVKAAQEAYSQHMALYKNGLNTIADLTQSFYALNRAETDNEIATINVWQALLLKASSSGHFEIFTNTIK